MRFFREKILLMETNRYFGGLTFAGAGIRAHADECCNAHPLYYGIQYIHSGPFYLSVNGAPVLHLRGPAAFLTSPDSVFAYGSEKNTTREHYHVLTTGPRIKSYLDSGLFVPAAQREKPYYPIHAPNQFLSHMLELIQLSRDPDMHDFAVAKFEYMLLLLGNGPVRREGNSFYQPDLERIVQRIMISPEKDWNFASEAEKLNISLKHFMRIFSEQYNEPPHRFVLRQRLYKAATLLVQSTDPIKTIAWKCGFRSEFYFSRLFRKYLLFTPANYRRTHRHPL